jgi:magnesium-transporting ATPase (P-type)
MAGIDIESLSGLSDEQVLLIRSREGFNELPSTTQRSIPGIILDVAREPMFILLVASGLIYVVLGPWKRFAISPVPGLSLSGEENRREFQGETWSRGTS